LSDLLIIEFTSEAKAEGVRETLLAMREDYLIELGDTAIAVAGESDWVKLNQLLRPTSPGAIPGVSWDLLIGLFFMTPSVGPAAPSVSQRMTELGIDDAFARAACRLLRSGNVALLLLIRGGTTDKVLGTLRRAGVPALRSAFDETRPEALRAALADARAAYAGVEDRTARRARRGTPSGRTKREV
jgi:uncharacterized membrane protein